MELWKADGYLLGALIEGFGSAMGGDRTNKVA